MKLKIVWPKSTHSVELEVSHMLPIPAPESSWQFSWYSKTNEDSLGPMFHKLTAHVRNVFIESAVALDQTIDTVVTIILGEVNTYITTVGSQATYSITGYTITT